MPVVHVDFVYLSLTITYGFWFLATVQVHDACDGFRLSIKHGTSRHHAQGRALEHIA